MKVLDFLPFPAYPERMPLTAVPLDNWSIEIEKADIHPYALFEIELVLYAPFDQVSPCSAKVPAYIAQPHGLKLFEDDGQVRFRLSIGSLVPGSQFALLIDGEERFGVHVVGNAGQEIEVNRIAQYLEAKTENRVRVERTASLLTVFMRPAWPGELNGKTLSVSLGTPQRFNTNAPELLFEQIIDEAGPVTKVEPPMNGYAWEFSDLLEGQIINVVDTANGKLLGGAVVEKGDTSQKINAKLGKISNSVETDLRWLETGKTWFLMGVPGRTFVKNTNSVIFSANYVRSDGDINFFDFDIQGELRPGNIFRFRRLDGTIDSHTVKPGDTRETVIAGLKFFGEPSAKRGQLLEEKFIAGSEEIANPHGPTITQQLVRTKEARTYYKIRMTVKDVQPGNIFFLLSAETVAVDGDTPATIARKLAAQLSGAVVEASTITFWLDTTQFVRNTHKGTPLTVKDTAPVTVNGSSVLIEKVRRSVQAWITMPCKRQIYHLALRKKGQAAAFALSNPIRVKPRRAGMSVLLIKDAWRFRLSGALRNLSIVREEEEKNGITTITSVRSNLDLNLSPMDNDFHRAMSELLKGSFFVEGKRVGVSGDYALSAEQPHGWGRSSKQTLSLTGSAYKCSVIEKAEARVLDNQFGLRLRLAGEEKGIETTTAEAVAKGTYLLEVYSSSPFPCKIFARIDGIDFDWQYLPGFGHTVAKPIWIAPGMLLEISSEEMPVPSCELSKRAKISQWACEMRTVQQLSEYSSEYSDEYSDKGKDIQVPESGFGGSGLGVTGWQLPTMILLNEADEITYEQYVTEYIPNGWPYFGPVYNPDECNEDTTSPGFEDEPIE